LDARDPLVSAAWLKQNLGDPEVTILDATWVPPFLKERPTGRASYHAGHIPGAVYFDIDEVADPGTPLKHMLPPTSIFADKVGKLGVSNSDHVIIYDSNGFYASARAWWMFRAMGHARVSVLDGGLTAWKAEGGAVVGDEVVAAPGAFRAVLRPDLVRVLQSMKHHVRAEDATILDARAQGRFDGTSPEPRPELASGHMPGSFCVPATDILTEDGHMKSVDELRPIFGGFDSKPIVTSCGSGVSAAVLSLALARIGQWQVALYDGSWSEWAAQADTVIEVRE
jgi:thiosulfate/3-mercaptopyruvate sulfurtransferase